MPPARSACYVPALMVGCRDVTVVVEADHSTSTLTIFAWNVASVAAIAALTAGSWMSAAARVTYTAVQSSKTNRGNCKAQVCTLRPSSYSMLGSYCQQTEHCI